MTTPAFSAATSGGGAATSSFTPTLPAHAAGNLILILVSADTTAAAIELNPNASSFTLLKTGVVKLTGTYQIAAFKKAASASETAPTFKWASGTINYSYVALTITDPYIATSISNAGIFDCQWELESASGTSHQPTTLHTPYSAGLQVLGYVAAATATTFTLTTANSWTEAQKNTAGLNSWVGYKTISANGAQTGPVLTTGASKQGIWFCLTLIDYAAVSATHDTPRFDILLTPTTAAGSHTLHPFDTAFVDSRHDWWVLSSPQAYRMVLSSSGTPTLPSKRWKGWGNVSSGLGENLNKPGGSGFVWTALQGCDDGITVNWGAGSSTGIIARIKGGHGERPFADLSWQDNSAADTTFTLNSVVTTHDNQRAIALFGAYNAQPTVTPASGWTELVDVGYLASYNYAMAAHTKVFASAASDAAPGSLTFSASAWLTGILLLVTPPTASRDLLPIVVQAIGCFSFVTGATCTINGIVGDTGQTLVFGCAGSGATFTTDMRVTTPSGTPYAKAVSAGTASQIAALYTGQLLADINSGGLALREYGSAVDSRWGVIALLDNAGPFNYATDTYALDNSAAYYGLLVHSVSKPPSAGVFVGIDACSITTGVHTPNKGDRVANGADSGVTFLVLSSNNVSGDPYSVNITVPGTTTIKDVSGVSIVVGAPVPPLNLFFGTNH